jgi:hypothetical protein
MRNRFGFTGSVSISILTFLFLISCNSTSSEQPKSDTTAAIANESALPPSPRYNLEGNLDTLFIPVGEFKTFHSNKIIFRFYIKNSDTLTLRGWFEKAKFDTLPDVILSNGRTSNTAKFGPDNYFGNLVLRNNDIQTIIRKINSTTPAPTYVLFAPQTDSAFVSQINYSILLTSDDPHPLIPVKATTATSTGTFLNPSPPRNSN